MAYVATTTTGMTVTFEDRDGNQSTVAFFAPSAVVQEDLETFATTTLPTTIGALSNAGIRRVTISRTYENDTFAQPPEESDVERKGVFVWLAADRSTSKNEIPSIRNTMVLDGTNNINTLDTAVAAFINMVKDDGLFDTYGLGNQRGEQITGTKSAPHKIHRKSSKG